MNKYRKKERGESQFSTPRQNLSLSKCTLNMNFLPYTVVEIFLTKNIEIRKKEQMSLTDSEYIVNNNKVEQRVLINFHNTSIFR